MAGPGSPTGFAVRARQLHKAYGEVVALDGVDLTVRAGCVHGLIGPNGAGKTTLLGLLLGLADVDAGELEVLGIDVGRGRPHPAGAAGFVDGPGLYPSLSARQNLVELARLRGDGLAEVDHCLEQVGLAEVAGDRVRGFSLGMRQRLGLAAALLTRPRLLVLDEPANGLDPHGARHVHRVLDDLAAGGTAVVLSSHRMDELAAICHEVTLLAAGQVVFSGPLDELIARGDRARALHRLRTAQPERAREVVAASEAVELVEGSGATEGAALVLRARGADLDELVEALVEAGVGVRALAPVVSPLEAAFLELTGERGSPAGTVA